MEMSSTTTVASSYYNVTKFAQNFSNDSNGGPLLHFECNQEINTNGLSDFIVYGIFINLIGLFGIFGNAISMIILSRPQMKSSINYLLIGLARCDTVLIIIAVSGISLNFYIIPSFAFSARNLNLFNFYRKREIRTKVEKLQFKRLEPSRA